MGISGGKILGGLFERHLIFGAFWAYFGTFGVRMGVYTCGRGKIEIWGISGANGGGIKGGFCLTGIQWRGF